MYDGVNEKVIGTGKRVVGGELDDCCMQLEEGVAVVFKERQSRAR